MKLKNMKRFNNLLNNKTIIVTGCSGFFGLKICEFFLSEGAIVIGLDKKIPVNSFIKNFSFFKCDITKEKSVKETLSKILKKKLKPNVLINNAGLDVPPSLKQKNFSIEKTSLSIWKKTHDVNVNGVFICSKIFGKYFLKNNDGVLVNIGSIYGIVAPDNTIYENLNKKNGTNFIKPLEYSSSKSSLITMTKYLGSYWAKKNIRVNCLVMAGIFNNQDKSFLKSYTKRIPIGRMADVSDYFGPLSFLISDMSKYMTGTSLIVDGGWTAI